MHASASHVFESVHWIVPVSGMFCHCNYDGDNADVARLHQLMMWQW